MARFNLEYADAPGIRPAPPRRRWVALTIDLSFIVVLATPAVIAAVSLAELTMKRSGIDPLGTPAFIVNLILFVAGAFMLAAGIVVQIIARRRAGATLGMALVGIRAMDAARFGDRGARLVDVANRASPNDERSLRAYGHIGELDRDGVADAVLPPLPGERVCADADLSPLFMPGLRPLSTSGSRLGADASVTIIFDSGVRYEVERAGLIGRSPRTAARESGMELVSVADDSRSVSKTHAEFGIDEWGFWIDDRRSRNGTAIRAVDGVSAAVDPGARTYVRPTDTVFIGSRWFVVRPAGTQGGSFAR